MTERWNAEEKEVDKIGHGFCKGIDEVIFYINNYVTDLKRDSFLFPRWFILQTSF